MKTSLPFIFLVFILFQSCGSKKEPPPFYDPDYVEDSNLDSNENDNDNENENENNNNYVTDEIIHQGETISVPFREKGGVKLVDVKLNDAIGVEMILDSGCSGALISVNEANYLYNKGVLREEDIEGITPSIIANGSVEINTVINIRKIVIGDLIICENVKATVADNPRAPLLLGNDILDRAASYEVDNQNKVIVFKIN